MSSLGPAAFGALGIVGSAAGSLNRSPAASDRAKAEQAEQKLQADDARLASRDLDDSIETEFSHGQVSDRDPDGRLPWQQHGRPESEPADELSAENPPRPPDVEGLRGGALDLDA